MPGKRKRPTRKSPDASHPMTQRLVELWERLWHKNKSRMALDLDVSMPTILRVLSGQQLPTGKLLEALAARPEINFRWFFTGQGQPLVIALPGLEGGRYLPIADELLKGSPEEHRACLSGVGFPVAEAFFKTTSYWYRLPKDSPLIRREAVQVGDLLLIDADKSWAGNSYRLPGRRVGFLVQDGGRERVVLGKVDYSNVNDSLESPFLEYEVDTFSEFKAAWFVMPNPTFLELSPNAKGRSRTETPPVKYGVITTDRTVRLSTDNVVCLWIKVDRFFAGTLQGGKT